MRVTRGMKVCWSSHFSTGARRSAGSGARSSISNNSFPSLLRMLMKCCLSDQGNARRTHVAGGITFVIFETARRLAAPARKPHPLRRHAMHQQLVDRTDRDALVFVIPFLGHRPRGSQHLPVGPANELEHVTEMLFG